MTVNIYSPAVVYEGHPDKVCDRISDMVVDTYISYGYSRVACETLATTNKVVLAGETRGPKINNDDLIEKVRSCIKDGGLTKRFSWKTAKIESHRMSNLQILQWVLTQKVIKMKVLVTREYVWLCL